MKGRLQSKFEQLRHDGFSGVAVVQVGNQILFADAAGEADPVRHRPYRVDTPVEIGSLTKPFTAAAILKLQDAGRLSVDDPISRFLPQAHGPLAQATIKQLLTHSSGLPISAGTTGTAPDNEHVDRDTFLRRVFDTPLQFAPGHGFNYSNAGYSLLAAIVERASGQPYDQYVQKHVIAPAKVRGIGYGPDVDVAAAAKSRTGRGIDETAWGEGGPYWNLLGNGGFIADPVSFVRWRRAFADGKIVSPAAVRAAGTPWVHEVNGPGGEGYGWIVAQSPTRGTVELAAGGNPDFTSEMRYYRDLGMITFVATNGDAPAGDAAARLIAAALGEKDPPPMVIHSAAEKKLIEEFLEALKGDPSAAHAFLDAHVGPVFRSAVGFPMIEQRFAAVRQALAGATMTGQLSAKPGRAVLKFSNGSSRKVLTIDFGGTPDQPRIAGFSIDEAF